MRAGSTHKVEIYCPFSGTVDLIIIANLYDPGREVGEVFLNIGKRGSTIQGLADGWAILASYCLQYGIPLEAIAPKFMGQQFAPSGRTSNPDIPECSSIYDYAMRWLIKFQQEADRNVRQPEQGS